MELRRFEKEGVLEPIEFSNWAAPIVALLKSDGKVRICGDFRVSVNPALKVDEYPISKVEDLLAMSRMKAINCKNVGLGGLVWTKISKEW